MALSIYTRFLVSVLNSTYRLDRSDIHVCKEGELGDRRQASCE